MVNDIPKLINEVHGANSIFLNKTKINEGVDFRPFTKSDYNGYGGAEAFVDGTEPFISKNEFKIGSLNAEAVVDKNGIWVSLYKDYDLDSTWLLTRNASVSGATQSAQARSIFNHIKDKKDLKSAGFKPMHGDAGINESSDNKDLDAFLAKQDRRKGTFDFEYFTSTNSKGKFCVNVNISGKRGDTSDAYKAALTTNPPQLPSGYSLVGKIPTEYDGTQITPNYIKGMDVEYNDNEYSINAYYEIKQDKVNESFTVGDKVKCLGNDKKVAYTGTIIRKQSDGNYEVRVDQKTTTGQSTVVFEPDDLIKESVNESVPIEKLNESARGTREDGTYLEIYKTGNKYYIDVVSKDGSRWSKLYNKEFNSAAEAKKYIEDKNLYSTSNIVINESKDPVLESYRKAINEEAALTSKDGKVTLVIIKDPDDGWSAMWAQDGKRNYDKSYFSGGTSPDYRDDAVMTAKSMISRYDKATEKIAKVNELMEPGETRRSTYGNFKADDQRYMSDVTDYLKKTYKDDVDYKETGYGFIDFLNTKILKDEKLRAIMKQFGRFRIYGSPIPLAEDISPSNVSIDTIAYQRVHAKEPIGQGQWAYSFSRDGSDPQFVKGNLTYQEAMKIAKIAAAAAGKTTVYPLG